MSDDEDYYDEFDEIFWIEEPEPEIADDLAATATYDAIFYDDPSLEVEDFYSDWDDVSDDYYDEDPTAVRIQRVMAKWPNRDLNINPAVAAIAAPPPQKKRKHQSKPKSKSIDAPKTDVASFRGTVWRTSTDETKSKLYEPGDGEKVALLKNWREVFRTSHPANERARIRKGAGAALGKSGSGDNGNGLNGRTRAGNGTGNGTARKDTEDHMEDEWDADAEMETSATAPVKAFSPPPVHASRVVESAADIPVNSKMIEHEYPIEGHENYEETLGMKARESKEGDHTRGKKSQPQVNGVAAGKSSNQSTGQPAATRGRKRKASVSHEESANKSGPDTPSGPRSKRNASKKVGEAEESTGPVRRSARNRDKK